MRTLLVRGMLAGLVAGVLAFLWAHFVGESPVRAAIAVEEAAAPAPAPGVPAEMREMWTATVGPAVRALQPDARIISHRRIKCFGVGVRAAATSSGAVAGGTVCAGGTVGNCSILANDILARGPREPEVATELGGKLAEFCLGLASPVASLAGLAAGR